jgi:peptidoglycan/xylan/chitin deacetylase (PgdA/CDA1 family)
LALFEGVARAAGSLISPRGDGARLTVLLYHRVLERPDALVPHEPDAAAFDAQLGAMSKVFRVLPLGEALALAREGRLPARSLCITFDDGYRDNVDVAVPILRRHGLSATFFIATGFLDGGRMMHDTVTEAVRHLPDQILDLGWLGGESVTVNDSASRLALIDEFVRRVKYLPFHERAAACQRLADTSGAHLPNDLMMTSEQVRSLPGLGMDVGAHTHDHPILSRLSPEDAFTQIVRGRDVLTQLLGSTPALFAYPNGKPDIDYQAIHVDMVKRAGFSAAVSVSMGTAGLRSDHFQIPRFIPWDHDPKRLVLRILAHPWRHPDTRIASA